MKSCALVRIGDEFERNYEEDDLNNKKFNYGFFILAKWKKSDLSIGLYGTFEVR